MVRTRHVAVAFALAAATTPFILAQPASADPGELTVGGGAATLFTGASPVIDFELGTDADAEAGPYSLDLFEGSTKVATIQTGTDVTELETVKWTIPTGVSGLVKTGLSVHVTSTASTDPFDAVESDTFEIRSSAIQNVILGDIPEATEEEPDPEIVPEFEPTVGSTHTLVWSKEGATGAKVNIDFVQTIAGKDKKTSVAKAVKNDGEETVTIPAKAVTGETVTASKIVVTPSNPAAAANDFDLEDLVAPSVGSVLVHVPDTTTAVSTARNGDTVTIKWTGGAAQLDLYAVDGTKPVAKIAKAATGNAYDFEVSGKLASGQYIVRATVPGSKPAIVANSGQFTITQPARGITPVGPLTQGETVTLEWEFATSGKGKVPTTVSLVVGTKLVKIDSTALTVNGLGELEWTVPAKQAAGSYKIRVANNFMKAGVDGSYVETDAFTIAANSTTMAPTTTPPTTTTAAPTTTTAAPTTTTAAP